MADSGFGSAVTAFRQFQPDSPGGVVSVFRQFQPDGLGSVVAAFRQMDQDNPKTPGPIGGGGGGGLGPGGSGGGGGGAGTGPGGGAGGPKPPQARQFSARIGVLQTISWPPEYFADDLLFPGSLGSSGTMGGGVGGGADDYPYTLPFLGVQ